MNGYILAGLAAMIALAGGATMTAKTPRGIRNNNAGNIRHGAAWQGVASVQKDAAFITFIAPEYGLRAIGRILRTYQQKYGLNTIAGVITRWAPPSENNTQSYIDAVARHVGASANAPLDFTKKTVLIPMMEAITRHENGIQPYNIALLNKAATMAGATA